MAKKFGKVLLATAVIGAAAAGTYYYFKKKKEEEAFDFDSDDTTNEEKIKRNYVPLDFEKAGEKVNVFVSKAGDVFEKTVDMVKQKVGKGSDEAMEDVTVDATEVVEDEFFDDDDLDAEPLDMDTKPIAEEDLF